MKFVRRGAVAAVVLLIAVTGGACSSTAAVDRIGLYYTGGMIQGQHFKKVVQPGSGAVFVGWGDDIHWLPAGQRNYIVSKVQGEGDRKGKDVITTPAKGGVNMDFQVSVYFKLNTHTDDINDFKGGTLRRFYEQICKKYSCDSNSGWDRMLNDNFRKIIETSMRERVFNYTVDELFANAAGQASGNNDAIQLIQKDIASTLKDNINNVLGGQFFCGPTFDRAKPDCPPFTFIINSAEPSRDDVRASFDNIRAAQNNAEAKKAEASGANAAQSVLNNLSPLYVEYLRIQAISKCAEKQGCTLIFNGSGSGVNVNAGGR